MKAVADDMGVGHTFHHTPVGVYFGTSSGELWGSQDEGESWRPIMQHLPAIVSVEAAELA